MSIVSIQDVQAFDGRVETNTSLLMVYRQVRILFNYSCNILLIREEVY